MHAWNHEFVDASPEGRRYEALAAEIDRALRFMAACGIDLDAELQLHQVDFYTSHEALLLGYEEALTRQDSLTGDWYDCSAHLLWIGDRTRQLDGAHVEFLAGIENPIGVKLGPDASIPTSVVALCERLNPERHARAGSCSSAAWAPTASPTRCRRCCAAVQRTGHPVVWMCDPMHGNTFSHASGYKTRDFDDVMRELHGFFAACDAADVWPGGVHVELTGENVTECLGGSDEVLGDHLEQRYETSATRASTPASRSTSRSRPPSSSALIDAHASMTTGGPQPRARREHEPVTRFEDLGPNSGLVEEMYQHYLREPGVGRDHWRDFFAGDAAPPTGDAAAPARTGAAAPAPAPAAHRLRPRRPGTGAPGPDGARRRRARAAARRGRAHRREHGGEPRRPDRDVGARRPGEAARGQPPDPQQPPGAHRRAARSASPTSSRTRSLRALADFPALNSGVGVEDGKPVVVRHEHVNLGLAVDVQRRDGSHSLLVPNIKDADTLDFAGVLARVRRADRARCAAARSRPTTSPAPPARSPTRG